MAGIKRYAALAVMTLGVVSLLCSCIKEDLSDCAGDDHSLLIGFENVKPNYKNEVSKQDVFIFGADDVLYKILSVSNISLTPDYTIPTRLPAGNYRLVSWSNHGSHYTTLPGTVIPGVSTFKQAVAILNVGRNGVVDYDLPTSLFGTAQARVGGVQSRSGESRIMFSLQQNSYRINLTVEGVPAGHHYTVTIADDNGNYYFDNSFAPGRMLHYTRGPILGVDGSFVTSLTTLRLERNRSPELTITDNTTGRALLTENLIALILAVEQRSGVQVDFSIEHEFDVHVLYNQSTLSATVTVNGWEVSLGGEEELE